MSKFTRFAMFALMSVVAGVVQAGPEIVPGNYRSNAAVQETSGPGLDPDVNACLYIDANASPNFELFPARIEFDGGAVFEGACTRMSKGKVKAGKTPKVKHNASNMAVCVGTSGANSEIALIFRPKGKGAAARLKKPQAIVNGINIVLADFLQDSVACPTP